MKRDIGYTNRRLKKARWRKSLKRAIRRGELIYGGFIELTEEMLWL